MDKEPAKSLRLSVPYINQSEKWPTGCESVSAVMLLNYLKIPVTVDEFIDRYLTMEPMEIKEGILYGPDPNLAFAGSPYDDQSFGAYPGVMTEALNRCFEDLGYASSYRAADATGAVLETLLLSLEKGLPVLYWTGIDLKETIKGPSWRIHGSDREFCWISNEHCMLLTGYEEDKLIFNDPWTNNGICSYDRKLAEQRHHELYDMAVVIERIKELP